MAIKNPKYPTKSVPPMKKMPDGNPYPYEQGEQVDGGVSAPEKVSKGSGKLNYKPTPPSNIGEDGLGGHK